MQLRTALALVALAFVVPAASQGGVPVPVSVRVVDPGRLTLGCFNADLPLAPTVEWTVPWECGGGAVTASGSIETSIDGNGVFHARSSGTYASRDTAIQYYRSATVEIDIPDYGESLTPLVLVPSGATWDATNSTTTNWVARSEATLTERGSAKFNYLTYWRSFGPAFADNSPYTSVPLISQFVAGDTVTFDLRITVAFGCSPSQNGQDPCSISWTESPDFQVFAIAPEPLPPRVAGCGLGPELALALPLLWWLRRARS